MYFEKQDQNGGIAMGGPVKIYIAVENGKTKIEIPVFDVEGRCYSAVMFPVAREDLRLMSHFKEHEILNELGNSVELAVAACERWIKEKLGQDVTVHEKLTT